MQSTNERLALLAGDGISAASRRPSEAPAKIHQFVSRIVQKKLLNRFFPTKFGGNVAHGPRKKFGGNPDHVTLRLWLGLRCGLVGDPPYSAWLNTC